MMTAQELLLLKSRMLLAAETASRIAGMGGEPLELDEETYQLVMSALLSLKTDTRKVLAEVDILRGMTTGNFDSLFGATEHGRSADVGATEQQEVVSGGGGERTESAEVGGSVRSSGPDRKKASRSRPRRNRRKSSGDSDGLEPTSGTEQVDSSTEVTG